jgi:protein-tyrosine-phosphatase
LKRILFLCASNDSLSLMAETLLRHIDSRNFESFSASLTDERIDPLCGDVMKEIGMELSTKRSLEELPVQRFDFVVTLDEASSRRSYSSLALETIHWKFENPAAASDEQPLKRRAFQAVRDQMTQRLRLLAIVYARSERVVVASASSASYTNSIV